MRILHVNKFLYRRGGAEGYMEDVAALQTSAGHEVAFFGMEHPSNNPTRYAPHFPPYLELAPPPASLLGKAKAVGRILYSRAAEQGIDAVLDDFRPDVAHLHNIYQHLSPSVLRPLARRGVPAVMTLHDYKLACPTYQFLDGGQVCDACTGGRFHNAVLRRCKDGSLGASAVCATELFLHTRTNAYASIRRFICPSRFMAEKMRAASVFPDRLLWLPHFIDPGVISAKEKPGTGVVWAGRLYPEKGVDVLIRAIGGLGSGVLLDIAGDGPQRTELEALAERVAPGRVRFHGALPKDELHRLIRSSAVLSFPSRWYENQPMIVLESFACGTPVVGTNLGGTPELIEPGVDGELVPPNDADATAAALQPLVSDTTLALEMGRAARAKVELEFSPGAHLDRLGRVYSEAVARSHEEAGAR